MNRQLTLFMAILVSLGQTPVHAKNPPAPKGVIVVLIDDIGFGDIDILHPSDLETPNIDSFYGESVRLTDFHVGTTCAPSRATLMTGRSMNAGGVWHTIAGRELLREDEQTMADVFRANGWRTGIFGKWHLGDGYPYSPEFRGFDVSVVHGGGGVGQGPDYWDNDYYSDVDFEGNKTAADVYWENGKTFKADRFCTDLWFERSKQFVKESVSEGRPFFCYIPTNAAHGPFNASHGYKKGFDGLIENVDHNMGRLDAFLTESGLKDDVLVIFSTDNGTTGSRLGGLRDRKGSHHEGGHHVPCFLRWKNGGLGGAEDTARDVSPLTAAMDLLPTFIDMFGLKKPAGGLPLDGMSLKEMLSNPNHTPVERTIVVDTQRQAGFTKWTRACVMRDEIVAGQIKNKWRLIRNSSNSQPELYDFLTDRGTNQNLASGNAQVIEDLSADYEVWWDRVSPGSEAYPPFVVNEAKEGELTLYAHSWIGNDMTPWNQSHVKSGEKGTGMHSVRFDRTGRYQIELRRWPREDGGPIDGKSSDGDGKVIAATKARLKLAGIGEATKEIEPGHSSVVFDLDVTAGKATTLSTMFMDEQGKDLVGAYYVYIRNTNRH